MAEKEPIQQQGRVQVKLDEDIAEGHYANLALIAHSPVEFVLDFARTVPGSPQARVQTRVILAAVHAKNLMKALEENVKRYEEQYGEIKLPGKSGSDQKFGFQS